VAAALALLDRDCEVWLDDAVVSAEHALLRWRSGTWELQDLHSRNGTYVNNRRLTPGEKIGLEAGARLGLGRRKHPLVRDGGPPLAHAVALDHERNVIAARDGLLVLPSSDEPEVTVLRRGSSWRLERADDVETVLDGAVIPVRDRTWRLHLPEPPLPTEDADDAQLPLATITLEFVVNDAGEQSELLEAAQGWIGQAELIRQLGYAEGRLHVEIHRVRRLFADAGVLDAANVIERHVSERKLRIGVAAIELHGA
jgi:hypothetical protein